MNKEEMAAHKERARLRIDLRSYKAKLVSVKNEQSHIKEFWQRKIDETEKALARLN